MELYNSRQESPLSIRPMRGATDEEELARHQHDHDPDQWKSCILLQRRMHMSKHGAFAKSLAPCQARREKCPHPTLMITCTSATGGLTGLVGRDPELGIETCMLVGSVRIKSCRR